MIKINKKILAILVASVIALTATTTIASNYSKIKNKVAQENVEKNVEKQEKTAPNTQQATKYIVTTSLNIVNSPRKYLNKTVKMRATFDKFSTLGLDYSKALRKSTDYIGILIQRDDVIDHDIPLSEMKLFMKKDLAQKHIDLECGDKIEIIAKEFSTALGDPWLDIESLEVIKKVKKEEQE